MNELTEQIDPVNRAPKLLDLVRGKIRLRHLSLSTERTYVEWIRRFILFHDKRHPKDMGGAEIESFLTHWTKPLRGRGEQRPSSPVAR